MTDMVKLADVGTFVSGGTPSRKHPEYFEGTIPWVSTPALNGGLIDKTNAVQLITKEAIANSATKLLPPHSLLVGIRVGIGKTAINTIPMCTNQDIVAITSIDETSWDIRYLAYAVQAQSSYLASQKRGATITGITSKLLKSVRIRHVDIETQHNYVASLNRITGMINKCEALRESLEALVKSRFVEMFGDPITNSKGWQVNELDSIFDIIDGDRGKNYPKAEDFSSEGFCLFLNASNVTKDGFRFNDKQFIDEKRDSLLRKGRLQRGDLVVTTRGTVGNIAFYDSDIPFERMRINSGMVILRPKAKINEAFFMVYFKNPAIYQRLISGTAQPQMPIKNMRRATVPLPPIEFQQEFAAFVQQVDKSGFAVRHSIEQLELLKAKLMQEYFS